MNEPERITGDPAREVSNRLENKVQVAAFEGGSMYCGEADGAFFLVSSDGFAELIADEFDEDLSTVARKFPDRASRDQYLREGNAMEAYRSRGWTTSPPGFSVPTVDGVESQLLLAVETWLSRMGEEGTDSASLEERDMQEALFELLGSDLKVRSELDIRKKADVAGAIPGWDPGGVDLVIDSLRGPIWAELKWSDKASNGLEHCLWDAAKLAGAVRARSAVAGYLIAGFPRSVWENTGTYARVSDLFSFSSWEDGTIVSDFPSTWSYYRRGNQKTFPRQVVSPIVTIPVGWVGSRLDDWEVRVARVLAPGSATVPLDEIDLDS